MILQRAVSRRRTLFYGQLAQAQQAYKQGNISQALALSAPLAQQSGTRGTAAKLFRADVLRHNKDLPRPNKRCARCSTSSRSPARGNLYYVLREQNKTAEAQAMLRTLPESLQQKLQPRVVTGMPGDSLRRQAQEQASSGNVSGDRHAAPGRSRYPDDAWMRLDLARLQKSGNDSEAASTMAAAYRPGASSTPVCRRAVCQRERRLAAGADAAGDSRRQPDQPDARFASAGELQPAAGDREDIWRRAIPSRRPIP
jgi:thioredoxin-like negative regulator of GroEL